MRSLRLAGLLVAFLANCAAVAADSLPLIAPESLRARAYLYQHLAPTARPDLARLAVDLQGELKGENSWLLRKAEELARIEETGHLRRGNTMRPQWQGELRQLFFEVDP